MTAAVQSQPASTRAVAALVLGIAGLAMCGLLSPVAWLIGHWELQDIRSWRAPQSGQGLAQAGLILGIVGSIPLLLGALLVLLAIPVLLLVALLG